MSSFPRSPESKNASRHPIGGDRTRAAGSEEMAGEVDWETSFGDCDIEGRFLGKRGKKANKFNRMIKFTGAQS